MHIKTLLNYVTNFKGFVFQDARLDRERNRLLLPGVLGYCGGSRILGCPMGTCPHTIGNQPMPDFTHKFA